MFCTNCGKEIPERAGFCPSCGSKVPGSTSDTMKDTLKKASEAVTSTAKNAGKRVNEATNGKAGEFAQTAKGKAKETAQNFTADIKQATQDKDAKGFFTKNKYRNTFIIAGVIVLFIVIGAIFSNNEKGNDTNQDNGKGASASIEKNSDRKNTKRKNVSEKEAKEIFWEEITSRFSETYPTLKKFYKLGDIGEETWYAFCYTLDWAKAAGNGSNPEFRYGYFTIDREGEWGFHDTFNYINDVEDLFLRRKDSYDPEREAQREKEIAQENEALQEELFGFYHIGEPAYNSELNLTATLESGDMEHLVLSFGDVKCESIIKQVIRSSDGGMHCYLDSKDQIEVIDEDEQFRGYAGEGVITLYDDGMDLSEYISPVGRDWTQDMKQYFFSYADKKVEQNAGNDDELGFDGNTASSVKMDGSDLSDYWGSYYDTSNLGLGIEIIGENDEPFVQISESETGKAWQFYCDYENNELVYTDGECFIEGDNRKYIYRNGTGKFYFKDEVLYWEDDIDGKGDGYKFEKLRPQDLLEMQYNNGN